MAAVAETLSTLVMLRLAFERRNGARPLKYAPSDIFVCCALRVEILKVALSRLIRYLSDVRDSSKLHVTL